MVLSPRSGVVSGTNKLWSDGDSRWTWICCLGCRCTEGLSAFVTNAATLTEWDSECICRCSTKLCLIAGRLSTFLVWISEETQAALCAAPPLWDAFQVDAAAFRLSMSSNRQWQPGAQQHILHNSNTNTKTTARGAAATQNIQETTGMLAVAFKIRWKVLRANRANPVSKRPVQTERLQLHCTCHFDSLTLLRNNLLKKVWKQANTSSDATLNDLTKSHN